MLRTPPWGGSNRRLPVAWKNVPSVSFCAASGFSYWMYSLKKFRKGLSGMMHICISTLFNGVINFLGGEQWH